ncbi:MAG: Gfo/Idh/MocA family oxidoreductase [Planctomycetota bacterium]
MSTSSVSKNQQPVTGRKNRVGLIGTGFIADVHLQVLKSVRHTKVVAVCDVQKERAEKLGRKYGVKEIYGSVAEMLEKSELDAVHISVPPAFHRDVARQCLEAGLHVLVEKPLVLDAGEVEELRTLAANKGVVLAVNHNQTFSPAVRKLQDHIAAGRLGRLEHLTLQHSVPLRQLETGDVTHFMFQTEANIVLEQGVHLFSMVYAMLGRSRSVQVVAGARRKLPNGVEFVEEWLVQLECERGNATVRMAFGKAWLETTVQAIGSDGGALLDLARGSCWLRRKTRWLEFLDHGMNLGGGSRHMLGRSFGSMLGYGLGLFKITFPDDPFLRGMRGSLTAFHQAVRGEELPVGLSPDAAHAVLEMCERTAEAAGVATEAPPKPSPLPDPGKARAGEVVVLGGTGLIGRRCVKQLLQQKRPVTLLVRKPDLLPEELRGGTVRVFVGDAADREVLKAAFAGAERILHLATAAGTDPSKIEKVMSDSVRVAGEEAKAAGVKRFVFASSTAALWLGEKTAIDGGSGTDAQPIKRAGYSRGKIASECVLRELAKDGADGSKGLPLTIIRPAIVVAHDGIAEHSGVGLWVRDNQCIGWGVGKHPLPFVLATDCAQAFVAALDAENAEGKTYNLAGDVRLSAREYVEAMSARTGRDYHYHPMPLWWMWTQELGKYGVKVAARKQREWPAYRDFASRSFTTALDCSDAKRDLDFQPESDRGRFLSRLFDERRG